VNNQLELRQTKLPLEIPASEEFGLSAFFPLAYQSRMAATQSSRWYFRKIG